MKDANKKDITVDIDAALEKKAFGFDAKETVEEYAKDQDGEIRLMKKKVTVKFVPPDVSAIKMLLERNCPISEFSDEELEAEKQRLLDLLEREKTASDNSKQKKTVKKTAKTVKKTTKNKKVITAKTPNK